MADIQVKFDGAPAAALHNCLGGDGFFQTADAILDCSQVEQRGRPAPERVCLATLRDHAIRRYERSYPGGQDYVASIPNRKDAGTLSDRLSSCTEPVALAGDSPDLPPILKKFSVGSFRILCTDAQTRAGIRSTCALKLEKSAL
jgi:hypothetical protein